MLLAQSNGIDGFALNLGAWTREPAYKANLSTMFEAAAQVKDFVLLPSFDAAGGLRPEESAEALSIASRFPNQLRIDGRPVVSTFDTSREWLRAFRSSARQRGLDPVIWPNMLLVDAADRDHGSELEAPSLPRAQKICNAVADFDGFFLFGAAQATQKITTSVASLAKCLGAAGKTFVSPVAGYYRGLGANPRVYEGDGMTRMQAMWTSAIENKSRIVELVTWNDWGEATYLRPLEDAASRIMYRASWPLVLNHRGYLAASKYFIHWFKTGSPPVLAGNRAFVFYQPETAADRQKDISKFVNGDRPDKNRKIYIHFQTTDQIAITFRHGAQVETKTVDPGLSNISFEALDAGGVLEFIDRSTDARGELQLRAGPEFANARLDYETDVVEIQ